jgi:putative flavoprotein involved in K+ transport
MSAPQDETPKDPAGNQHLDVVVVGGSQAGLAMAWHLAQQGLRFVVLEAGPEVGHVWRSRWDSLKLFTPAQYDALPGMPFPAPADTYPTKDPVADYLQAYVAAFDLPVRLNAEVTGLTRTDEGFEVQTADQTYRARQVVVATGPFQVPFIPPMAARLDPSVTQVHSADYRNPQALPDGPVLVVGGEGAADLGQHLGWGDGVRPAVGVVQQLSQGLALVGVGDTAAQGPPQPLDPVSVRVIGRGVDQHQVLAQLGKQPAQQP